jgi:hypothetical protein
LTRQDGTELLALAARILIVTYIEAFALADANAPRTPARRRVNRRRGPDPVRRPEFGDRFDERRRIDRLAEKPTGDDRC